MRIHRVEQTGSDPHVIMINLTYDEAVELEEFLDIGVEQNRAEFTHLDAIQELLDIKLSQMEHEKKITFEIEGWDIL